MILLVLLVLVFSVYAEDEKDVIVGRAKELKEINAKKIIWKKDRAKMAAFRLWILPRSLWVNSRSFWNCQATNRLNVFSGTMLLRIPLLTDAP